MVKKIQGLVCIMDLGHGFCFGSLDQHLIIHHLCFCFFFVILILNYLLLDYLGYSTWSTCCLI